MLFEEQVWPALRQRAMLRVGQARLAQQVSTMPACWANGGPRARGSEDEVVAVEEASVHVHEPDLELRLIVRVGAALDDAAPVEVP